MCVSAAPNADLECRSAAVLKSVTWAFLGKCLFSLFAFFRRGNGKMQILARKLKFFVDDFPYLGNLLMVIKQ